ncbi:hypothetical protein J2X16_001978 [Pelomonas aquatica]|uniref:Uncharacterized protein n=1 Tax=Pelomonas aquatica TaxID=431058 RepID=A0ABU1ZA98_9BURK|nr:hypothetical protein [Pelomonas aquatica]MDR7296631.1 hypothetical protein [Pelomonas aquatica]
MDDLLQEWIRDAPARTEQHGEGIEKRLLVDGQQPSFRCQVDGDF